MTKPSMKALALTLRSFERMVADVVPLFPAGFSWRPRYTGTDICEWFFYYLRAKLALMNLREFFINFRMAWQVLLWTQASEEARGYPLFLTNNTNVAREYVRVLVAIASCWRLWCLVNRMFENVGVLGNFLYGGVTQYHGRGVGQRQWQHSSGRCH